MDDEISLLFPYVTMPRRVADTAVEALRAVPGVTGIALLGSLAGDEADGLSEVGLAVGCAGDDNVARACAAALRSAMPLRYYAPFVGPAPLPGDAPVVEQPSGRYWPWGESAFHWIDLCLLPPDEYAILTGLDARAHPASPTIELFNRPEVTTHAAPVTVGDAPAPVVADERERAIAATVFAMLKGAKEYLRGDIDPAAFRERYLALLKVGAGAAVDEQFAGGRLGDLVAECLQIRMAIERLEQGG